MDQLCKKLIIIFLLLFSANTLVCSQELSDTSAEVYINHLYFYLDSTTYYHIMNNDFLKDEFATFEHRTTTNGDRTYTAIYFYGTNTYFEFFNADADTGVVEKSCGIALGVERANALNDISAQLTGDFAFTLDSNSRQWNQEYISWYSDLFFDDPLIYSGGSDDNWTIMWIMEYSPEFLIKWHPNPKDQIVDITRRAVLNRYKSVLEDQVSNPIMSDIMGITLHADSIETKNLLSLFDRVGYNIEVSDSNTVLSNGVSTISIIPSVGSSKGLTEIRFRINATPLTHRLIKFSDKSELQFISDSLAIWTFR